MTGNGVEVVVHPKPGPHPNVVQCISAVMASVQKVGKGGRNTQQNYSFRGIDDVLNNVGPALREHGVVVIPKLEDCAYNVVEVGQKRSLVRECTVRVRYIFYGPNGDSIECVVPGEAMDSGDKSTSKAMSVAFRVALIQALAIPTGDPDVDSTSYERAAPAAPEQPTEVQVANFDALAKAIAGVESKPGLKTCWDTLVEAYKQGDITTAQANELKAEITKRKAEFDDSTSDTDGSGGGAQPAGTGTGPDGAAAGDGGPGLDGEAGGVRPGVQPRVRGRNGSGGSAQASGSDRNTPAAVGG